MIIWLSTGAIFPYKPLKLNIEISFTLASGESAKPSKMYKVLALVVCLSVSALVDCEKCDSSIVQKSADKCNRTKQTYPELSSKLEKAKDDKEKKALQEKIDCCGKMDNTNCRNKVVEVSRVFFKNFT